MTSPGPKGWPNGVRQIDLEDLGRLGINSQDELFWDGRKVEIKRRLNLTKLQQTFAWVVTIMAVLGGLGGFLSGLSDASEFLCARHIGWLSCPAPELLHLPPAP